MRTPPKTTTTTIYYHKRLLHIYFYHSLNLKMLQVMAMIKFTLHLYGLVTVAKAAALHLNSLTTCGMRLDYGTNLSENRITVQALRTPWQ